MNNDQKIARATMPNNLGDSPAQSKRTRAAILDRLAVCQQCPHYEAKRVRPTLPGDGYCGLLSCRLARSGLVAYISQPKSTCPEKRWRKAFAARRQATSSTSSPAIAASATREGAQMPHHVDLRHDSPVSWVKDLMRQPPGPWPAHWAGFRNVETAFVELFDEFIAGEQFTPPADWSSETTPSRGIVICGGGWRFFASLYVNVRMIRHTGCALPIQVWYLGNRGEFDPRFAAALAPFGVVWIDADAEARRPGRERRILGGWEMKPFAIAYAPWREVLFLDADSYPVRDPETLFDDPRSRAAGAVFFPDQNPLQSGQFSRFGVTPRAEASFESGQLWIDKLRHWRALSATIFMNDFSDYVYRHIYGDKDTFHLAWRKTASEYAMTTERPGWNTIAFVHHDFDGRPLFIHRTRDKFRFGVGRVDGVNVSSHEWYMTAQWSFSQMVEAHGGAIARSPHGGIENLFVRSLPMENEAHAFLHELEQIMRPLGVDGPTSNLATIEATAADFQQRRRRRRTANVLCVHPRSAANLAIGIARRLAANAGVSLRSITLDDADESRRAAIAALDHAGLTINAAGSSEIFDFLAALGDWRLVHVVRDPRDVVVSKYFATLAAAGGELPATASVADRLIATIDQLGALWGNLRTWPADDDRTLTIRFGELVADPAAAVARIAAHYGFRATPAEAAAIAGDLAFATITGRQRGDENREHDLRRAVVGEWRELFDDAVASYFDLVAGDLLPRWGEQS